MLWFFVAIAFRWYWSATSVISSNTINATAAVISSKRGDPLPMLPFYHDATAFSFALRYTYRMKQGTKILIGIIVVVAVAAGVWLGAPLFYDSKAAEPLPSGFSLADSIAEGTFTGADSFHRGSGTAHILEQDDKRYVRFENDFSVTNGPDLFIYLGRDGQYDAETNLGRLKGSKGAQNYEIPGDIDVSQYNEVWVWCRAFATPFSSARLQ